MSKKISLNKNQIRQGDVLCVYVENTETPPKLVEPGQTVVLAFGEQTGHQHALRSDAPVTAPPSKPVFDATAERYIQLLDSGKLSHEEHDVAIMRAGTIEIGVQVEAGPHNMLRRVVEVAQANAAHIVKCVNAHDDLVIALQVLVDNGGIGPEQMFDDARAALKKANAGTFTGLMSGPDMMPTIDGNPFAEGEPA